METFSRFGSSILDKSSVCRTLKAGLVLSFFKGRGTKANNKDNYRDVESLLFLLYVKFMK